jgi:hypothetical protein
VLEPSHRTGDRALSRRRIAVVAGAAVVLLAALAVAATREPTRAATATEAPTDAQVRALLSRKYAEAQRHDMAAFCADTSSPEMCANHWARAGGDAGVPSTPPHLAQSRVDFRYRALRVCGTDGLGNAYRTDFVVDLHDGAPRAVLPVFWSDRPWSGVHADGEASTTTVPPPKGC